MSERVFYGNKEDTGSYAPCLPEGRKCAVAESSAAPRPGRDGESPRGDGYQHRRGGALDFIKNPAGLPENYRRGAGVG